MVEVDSVSSSAPGLLQFVLQLLHHSEAAFGSVERRLYNIRGFLLISTIFIVLDANKLMGVLRRGNWIQEQLHAKRFECK